MRKLHPIFHKSVAPWVFIFIVASSIIAIYVLAVMVSCPNYSGTLSVVITDYETKSSLIDSLNNQIVILYQRKILSTERMQEFNTSRNGWYIGLDDLRKTRDQLTEMQSRWKEARWVEDADSLCQGMKSKYEEAGGTVDMIGQLLSKMVAVIDGLKVRTKTTNDPLSDKQYYISSVNANDYIEKKESNPIVVAVIDDGIYVNHEDLVANIWKNTDEIIGNSVDDDRNGYVDDIYGYNFFQKKAELTVTGGHGTQVAGIIGAQTNNGLGIAGFTNNIRLMSLIACDATGCSRDAIDQAIKYAADNGASVINLSLGSQGTTAYSAAYDEAVQYASARGSLIVAASGNGDVEGGSGQDLGFIPQSPVCNDGAQNLVLGVGAIDPMLYRTQWSNYGICVDTFAPGVDITSTAVPAFNNGYPYVEGLDGTSFSAPIISGIAARIRQKYPTATVAEVIGLVRNYSEQGVVDFSKLISASFSPTSNTPSISQTTTTQTICPDVIHGYLGSDGKCYCKDGYTWNGVSNSCSLTASTGSVTTTEKVIDQELVNRLRGRILLQVQSFGEAWYLNPDDGNRYYMKDGAAAFALMRKFALGITDIDLAKIPQFDENRSGDTKLVNRLKGKILLQVEHGGDAWYVSPANGKRYFMGLPSDAYNLMRTLGLGITNQDLEKVPIGTLE